MSHKKIITHFIGDLNFGGIQRLVLDLVLEQKKNDDITIQILVLKDDGEFKKKFYSSGVSIISINPPSTYVFSIFSIKKIINIFKKSDILHFHGFHVYIAILALFLKKRIVYTVHGGFAFGRKKRFRDHINHFFRNYFMKWFVDELIANSNFIKIYLNQIWNLNLINIKVILNGINTNLKANKDRVKKIKSEFNNKFIIGTTSRLAGAKNIDRLIKAYKLFSNGKKDVALLIVGDGSERENLIKYAKNQNVDDIFFIGFKENVFDYQSAFNVCVFPSKNEPFGLVAVESYCANKPVLVFNDGGGLKEIVSKFKEDDIVNSNIGLVDRMQFYYDNLEQYDKNDFFYIKNYFSSQRMEKDYSEIYKNL